MLKMPQRHGICGLPLVRSEPLRPYGGLHRLTARGVVERFQVHAYGILSHLCRHLQKIEHAFVGDHRYFHLIVRRK